MFSAKVLKDSVSVTGVRITTVQATYARVIHSELMTHRVFSRNAASSRAIPISKMIKQVWNAPFVPVWFGAHQSGMQAKAELEGWRLDAARVLWFVGGRFACILAWLMMKLGMHKQIVNRVLEPWSFITVIITATEWNNFFALRCHPDAQPEIKCIAEMIRGAMKNSKPELLNNRYHLPLVDDLYDLVKEGYTIDEIVKICVGRCARISYLTHDGKRSPQKDIELCDDLRANGHMSPFEHCAWPMGDNYRYANFKGWRSVRRDIPNEDDFSKVAQELEA